MEIHEYQILRDTYLGPNAKTPIDRLLDEIDQMLSKEIDTNKVYSATRALQVLLAGHKRRIRKLLGIKIDIGISINDQTWPSAFFDDLDQIEHDPGDLIDHVFTEVYPSGEEKARKSSSKIVFHPYQVTMEPLWKLIKLCRKYGLLLGIRGDSEYFPGASFRVEISPPLETSSTSRSSLELFERYEDLIAEHCDDWKEWPLALEKMDIGWLIKYAHILKEQGLLETADEVLGFFKNPQNWSQEYSEWLSNLKKATEN